MMRKVLLWIVYGMLLFGVAASAAAAGSLKAYIAPFKVTGTTAHEELQGTLQGLLASRLGSDRITVVDAAQGADLLVSGNYIVFGKVFSLDIVVKDAGTGATLRAFEQGESQDDLIPAVGRLAKRLAADMEKSFSGAAGALSPERKGEPPAAAPVQPAREKEATQAVPAADIVRPEAVTQGEGSGAVGGRLEGVMVGLAPLRTTESGERELFLAQERRVRLYAQGKELRPLAEITFGNDEKIIAVDTADLDGNGAAELYVTLVRGEELASQVWSVEGKVFKRLAADLPYFFRAMAGMDGKKRLYAQPMGRDADFFGDVSEVVKRDGRYELVDPLKMPRFASIYNFNFLVDKDGKRRLVVIHPDGFLLVYAESGEELWRSNDKYGGSELYFTREDQQNVRVTGEVKRKIFLEQRITVTPAGEIIVPQNSGFWTIGNSRSFSKNSLYAFAWNGAALEERWHTRPSQNYLADYCFDEKRKELLLLEVVKKSGMIEKGASALFVKKVE